MTFLDWLFSLFVPTEQLPPPEPQPPINAGVYVLINNERKTAGLRLLGKIPSLVRAAQKHADWMQSHGTLSHYEGRSTWIDRAKAEGFAGNYVGEIIAHGQRSPEEVVEDWMSSSGHRREILGNRSQFFGAARAGTYWCVVFGGAN